MQTTIKYPFLFFFLISLTYQISAQNIITYSFVENSFDKIIPFDEVVTFKFDDIPGNPDSFLFWYFEVKNDSCKQDTVRFKRRIEEAYSSDDTISLFIINQRYFKPNRDYIFGIILKGEPRSLNNKEKDAIIKQFEEANLVSKILKELNKDLLEDNFDNYANNVNKAFNKIQNLFDSIPEKVLNREVNFNKSKTILQNKMKNISDFANRMYTINEKTKNFYRNYELTKKANSFNDTLSLLKRKLENLNFFPISQDEANQIKEILNFLDKPEIINSLIDKKIIALENFSTIKENINQIKEKWDELLELNNNNKDTFYEDQLLESTVSELTYFEFTSQTYTKVLIEQSRNYIAADIGMGYVPSLDKFVSFTHASIYFRPIKRTIPLSRYKRLDEFISSRLSFDIGISLNSIVEDNRIKGFAFDQANDTNKGLMIGFGFRVLPFAKINGGTMVYLVNNPNPIINKYSYNNSFYIGASIDLSVSAFFKENFRGQLSSDQ